MQEDASIQRIKRFGNVIPFLPKPFTLLLNKQVQVYTTIASVAASRIAAGYNTQIANCLCYDGLLGATNL
ncbi:hypothetical protein OPV22_015829 [Ensete ventricosum]|uniref:Uncharacterized protein n=1 Tax=Ensete ventricosum TaxID=4639 RepID=A0AAV8PMW0_ENSVE|nr:hypothetical protein OPV22_015829 [Ensete ventricosum]